MYMDETQAEVATEEAFQAELEALIRAADENGVAVEGGWSSPNGTGSSEWGIEIYEVQREE